MAPPYETDTEKKTRVVSPEQSRKRGADRDEGANKRKGARDTQTHRGETRRQERDTEAARHGGAHAERYGTGRHTEAHGDTERHRERDTHSERDTHGDTKRDLHRERDTHNYTTKENDRKKGGKKERVERER